MSLFRLPSLEGRRPSAALTDTGDTRLGRSVAPRTDAHPGLSGVHALRDARDAFAARALLARAAERSLDVQYYIWNADLTGTLLLDCLLSAAARGVRVRLLLDDNNTSGLDGALAALNTHPNVEVRLFNPTVFRRARPIGYLTDFRRLNRRMHNKSFTADNLATIVGGRNVGDEYFGATHGVLFADLDVIAVGPIVQEVSRRFDLYWESASSYPVERLLGSADPASVARVESAARRVAEGPDAQTYVTALRESPVVADLLDEKLELTWVVAQVVCDDPAKALGREREDSLVIRQLTRILGDPAVEVQLVSPYFVPTAAGVAWFQERIGRGVRVQVLTNSLEATDVALVHAGYSKRREPLLAEGVLLFELKRAIDDPSPRSPRRRMGSSGASLHAKTFAVDRSRVFVGSFNFDPRSARLNTEMGFVLESAELAAELDAVFRTQVPEDAYEVRRSETGALCWMERRGANLSRHDTEPGTSRLRRLWISILSKLPIEWLL